jgi:periplasmic divalent cation tolerance protein
MSAKGVLLVLSTVPSDEKGAEIARRLVEEKLAACVNIVPGVRSIYRWQEKLCDDAEALCIIKTRASLFPALRKRLVALHPYEVPEILALPVAAGHTAYLEWVVGSLNRQGAKAPRKTQKKD